ncbi:hypothetical protein [Salipaludibacillus sp. CF4.18]|uniref:hypothetical protein n=1 Tax=Salipaludibacillus sp. CF4.18 TaxID=3373081 RepID=UPI003EE66E1F
MEKLKRVVVKEELVGLTGKVNHAIVLNQMVYWSERVKDAKQFADEEVKRKKEYTDQSPEELEDFALSLKSGWIYKTSDQMVEETMNVVSRKTIDRIFSSLVESGWLLRRKNPNYKWDKTYQYRVDLMKIQQDLHKLGYSLEGYSLINDDTSNGQSDDSENTSRGQDRPTKGHNDDSVRQPDDSQRHGDQAITKTIHRDYNSEITKESINLSQIEELNGLQLPTKIKQILKQNLHRLIDDSVSTLEIDLFFNSKSNQLADNDFAIMLNNVLSKTKGKIGDINSLLASSSYNYYMNNIVAQQGVDDEEDSGTTYNINSYDWLNN